MPTRDIPRARHWRFCQIDPCNPGQSGTYMASRPITETELRKVLRVLFHARQLPTIECWPEGEVEYANAD